MADENKILAEAPPAPRDPMVILVELLTAIFMYIGQPPHVAALHDEFVAAAASEKGNN